MASANGPLVIADTGHHRLLLWSRRPEQDFAEADFVIGQPDYGREGRNAKGEPGPATLNVPTGVATHDGVLAVADAWNHRVLIWLSIPESSNQPADIVLGHENFSSVLANRGGEPSAATLNWCYGVAFIDGRLAVADTGNRRVLLWDTLPERNGAPADHVLGQRTFDCRDENAGEGVTGLGMRWPHGIALLQGMLFVSDAGNNRVMVWDQIPDGPGTPCNFVLGQNDLVSSEHNRASYLPDAAALNMPYSIASAGDTLVAADTANSRLVGWGPGDISQGAPATGLAGQHDFGSKGDNRWQLPVRDSLCWPYGLTVAGNAIIISDSGNNRVMLWEKAA